MTKSPASGILIVNPISSVDVAIDATCGVMRGAVPVTEVVVVAVDVVGLPLSSEVVGVGVGVGVGLVGVGVVFTEDSIPIPTNASFAFFDHLVEFIAKYYII